VTEPYRRAEQGQPTAVGANARSVGPALSALAQNDWLGVT